MLGSEQWPTSGLGNGRCRIWSDGILSAAEFAALFAGVDAQKSLTPSGRAWLQSWMDPQSPPTAMELSEVRGRIRSATLSDVAMPCSVERHLYCFEQ